MFTCFDAGCYADGALGHAHVRAKLAELCDNFSRSPRDGYVLHQEGSDLCKALQGPPSDDFSEEDRAVEFLNTVACDHSCLFSLEDGDLLLLESSEGE